MGRPGEHRAERLEGRGVGVDRGEQRGGDLAGEHRERRRAVIGAERGERVGQVPVGQDEQVAVGLVDEAELAELQVLKPTRKRGLVTERALGDAVDEPVRTRQEGDGLARLGPFAVSQTDGVVVDRGHGWRIVTAIRLRPGRGLLSGLQFDLVDAVLEESDDAIVTIKHVSGAEEYLQDHFAGFPVLPGVMMLEAMVQAGRRLAERGRSPADPPLVLGTVRGLKYGRFVPPGCSLVVHAQLGKAGEDGSIDLKATATVREADGSMSEQKAASGRLTLRPVEAGA